MMRILVTGSRDWKEWGTIAAVLRDDGFGIGPATTLVSGACPTGADKTAEGLADALRWTVERHPAEWSKHDDACPDWHWGQRRCKMAGFRRNAEMVALGADLCFAFIGPCNNPMCENTRPHGSHGATHCASLAEKAGIRTIRYTPHPQES